jgi:hypothetical protein
MNRSQLSEAKTNDDEQHSLIKKHDEQPCFPTQNDRIAFVDQNSIEDRCVRFYFFFIFKF